VLSELELPHTRYCASANFPTANSTGNILIINLIKFLIVLYIENHHREARWSSGQCARRAIAESKHRSQWLGWVTKIYYLELLRASEGTLSRWSRLHLQSLAPTNPYWARVVGYGPFSLWLIHNEGLCPSSGDINRLMMMMMMKCIAWRTVDRTSSQ
jgi:hypothetical protein